MSFVAANCAHIPLNIVWKLRHLKMFRLHTLLEGRVGSLL